MNAADPLIDRDLVVWSLQQSLVNGTQGLSDVPGLIKRVVAEDCWRERIVRVSGQIVQFARFEEFVQSGPPEGLGGDLRILKRMCADDPEALDAIDRATVGKPGGDHANRYTRSNDDISNIAKRESPTGTTSQAALRRLRKDRPDLHARVLAEELSPHRAMVEAGFRPKTLTVPREVAGAARVLRRHFTEAELRELCAALQAAEA